MAGGRSPPYPVTCVSVDEEVTVQLQKERDVFGSYIVANYWPFWRDHAPRLLVDGSTGETELLTFDWLGFIKLVDYLYDDNKASFIDKGRLFEIDSMAFGTREHPEFGQLMKRAITEYRFKSADNLDNQELLNPFGKLKRKNNVAQGDIFDEDHIDAIKEIQKIIDKNNFSGDQSDKDTKQLKKFTNRLNHFRNMDKASNLIFESIKINQMKSDRKFQVKENREYCRIGMAEAKKYAEALTNRVFRICPPDKLFCPF